MRVTFYLGPGGAHLSFRKLRVTRMMRAGDATRPYRAFSNNNIANTTEIIQVDIPINQIYEAELTDIRPDGTRSNVDVLHFHTGELQFPGPRTADRLSVIMMEFESSSSLSSISTSSSSLSSISTSSSSLSSSSLSSLSSISTSSSSISTSSVSTSSSASSSSLSSLSSISTSSSSVSSQSTSSSASSLSSQSSSSS